MSITFKQYKEETIEIEDLEKWWIENIEKDYEKIDKYWLECLEKKRTLLLWSKRN